jgi:hypothetical protein
MSTGGRSGWLCNGDFSRAACKRYWAEAETGQFETFEATTWVVGNLGGRH